MKKFLYFIFALHVVFPSSFSWAAYYSEGRDGLTEDTAYVLDSVDDILEFRDRINEGLDSEDLYYVLDFENEEVDLTAYTDWKPIGDDETFKGHFNGNNHTIFVNISNNDYGFAAFFGNIETEEGYSVKNLNVDASGDNGIRGRYAGGIAAWLSGGSSIENCTFTGSITSTSVNNGSNYGGEAGGIVSTVQGGGIIRDCIVRFSVVKAEAVNELNQSYGTSYAGGIAALMSGNSIENCKVIDTEVTAVSYAPGENENSHESHSSYAGGMAGYAYFTIKGCSFSGNVFSSQYAGGITGYADNAVLENNSVIANASVEGNFMAGGISAYLKKSSALGNHVRSFYVQSHNDSSGGIAGYIDSLSLVRSNDVSFNTNITSFGGISAGGVAGVLDGGIIKDNISYAFVSANSEYRGGVTGKITGLNSAVWNNLYYTPNDDAYVRPDRALLILV